MESDGVLQDAARLEMLLPQLMRRLFTLLPEHAVNELPVAQLRVCSILQAGPRPVSMLSEELGTTTSAVTQILDRLERAGLVERAPGDDDRRVRMTALTPQGEAVMQARRQHRVRGAAKSLARLCPEDRKALIAAVERALGAAG